MVETGGEFLLGSENSLVVVFEAPSSISAKVINSRSLGGHLGETTAHVAAAAGNLAALEVG